MLGIDVALQLILISRRNHWHRALDVVECCGFITTAKKLVPQLLSVRCFGGRAGKQAAKEANGDHDPHEHVHTTAQSTKAPFPVMGRLAGGLAASVHQPAGEGKVADRRRPTSELNCGWRAPRLGRQRGSPSAPCRGL